MIKIYLSQIMIIKKYRIWKDIVFYDLKEKEREL